MLPVAIIVYLSHAVAIVPILHPIGPAEIMWNKTKDACPREYIFIIQLQPEMVACVRAPRAPACQLTSILSLCTQTTALSPSPFSRRNKIPRQWRSRTLRGAG